MKNHKRTAGDIIFLRKFKNSFAKNQTFIAYVCATFGVATLDDLSSEQLAEVERWAIGYWSVIADYSLEIDRLRGNRFVTMKPQPMSC